MQAERLQLAGFERVKYFAPVAICGYLSALCVALIITSAFLDNMRDAIAITAAGVFGLLVSGGPWARRFCACNCASCATSWCRRMPIRTRISRPSGVWPNVGLARDRERAGRCLEARTRAPSLAKARSWPYGSARTTSWSPASAIPGVGFSLVGRRRCTQNRELVRLAVSAEARDRLRGPRAGAADEALGASAARRADISRPGAQSSARRALT